MTDRLSPDSPISPNSLSANPLSANPLSRRRFLLGGLAGLTAAALFDGSTHRAALGDEPTTANASPTPLRNASQLAELLRPKIGGEFPIPASVPCDVLGAEQKSNRILLLKSGADWNAPESLVWEWNPATAPELSAEQARWFSTLSECKPAPGTDRVMIAASGGGVAIVRVADRATLFFGFAGGNTHSVAELPDGAVVAASSTGAALTLFPASENANGPDAPAAKSASEPVGKIEFFDAHGVVWDAKRELLWALGGREIAAFESIGTPAKPALKEVWRGELPELASGGHDLYPAPGFDALITTGRGVNAFDPTAREFFPISDVRRIKSFSLTPDGVPLTMRAVGTPDEWWSETIFFGDKADSPVGTLTGARFYKARWFVPNDFSAARS